MEVEAATSASANDAAASLPVRAGIPVSLFSWCVRSLFLDRWFLAARLQFNPIWQAPSTKSPRDGVAGPASLVVWDGRERVCDCEKLPLSLVDQEN
jgi:hypothetical protein